MRRLEGGGRFGAFKVLPRVVLTALLGAGLAGGLSLGMPAEVDGIGSLGDSGWDMVLLRYESPVQPEKFGIVPVQTNGVRNILKDVAGLPIVIDNDLRMIQHLDVCDEAEREEDRSVRFS